MLKKIFLLVILLAVITNAQEENSNIKKASDYSAIGTISVTIGGSFIVNGTFYSTISERVDQFVSRLFNEARNAALNTAREDATLEKLNKKIESYPRRNIILKRATGEVVNIDLEKFRLTGDFKFNPYLKNDDVLIFPEANPETNFVSIDGAVNFPTKFQFVEGDKLSDALLFARGINPAYDNVSEVEIYRLDKTGNNEEIIKAGIKDIVELKIGDRIKVLSDENYKKDFKVLVLGEVKTPGYVFVKKNNTTIRELIERAGGFTENASLENAELLRGTSSQQLLRMKFIKEQYEKNPEYRITKFDSKFNYQNLDALMMARSANITVEDSLVFSMDNILRLFYSPGVVDFTKVDDTSSREGDFTVKDGDVVLVPERENLVYLFGQVKSPGYVQYEEGKDYKYYIEKAGGETESADGDVKIIKLKSRAWSDADENSKVEAGDAIYLTKSLKHRWYYYIPAIGSVASVIAGLASLYYLLFIAK